MPDQLAPWIGRWLVSPGTDGFGRSENRAPLRRFFEADAELIVAAALARLARESTFDAGQARQAYAELGLDTECGDPETR